MQQDNKIGLGGGCHWCTEAVFQALNGVTRVEQGYIASRGKANTFSEGVIVTYDPEVISLQKLIEIHLHTHKSTSRHSFRNKYRSAVYYFDMAGASEAENVMEELQSHFREEIITEVLPFREFKASRESIQDYYQKNPDAPFCRRYIHPKLELLRKEFSRNTR